MPVGSSSVKVSWGLPILEVGVIGEDSEGVLGPSQIVSPMGECFHHGKQLSFVNVVVTLCGGKGGGVISDRVEFGFPLFVQWHVSFASLLREHCSNPICGSIGLQIEATLEVRLDKDWFSAHEGLEHFECLELGFPPMPYYALLC